MTHEKNATKTTQQLHRVESKLEKTLEQNHAWKRNNVTSSLPTTSMEQNPKQISTWSQGTISEVSYSYDSRNVRLENTPW